jgi:ankyrin repeat protein
MPRYALFLGLALAAVGSGCGDRRDITPLMWAARTGDVGTMRRLLDAGADPYQRDVLNGWTPLFHAIHKGQIDAVRLLLDRGVNPNQGARGTPAVRFAEQNGEHAIADLLVQYGADPRPPVSPAEHLFDLVDSLLR